MNKMARKNLHIPDDVLRRINDVLHTARYRSETEAVVSMLEGAADRLLNADGYVYLMRGEKGLKIGTSVQPNKRAATLKSELLYCIRGDRLTEIAAHMIWGRHRKSGEWFLDRQDIVDWFSSHPLRVDNLEDSGRIDRLVVLFTEDEKRRIERAAQKDGVSTAVWIRMQALGDARTPPTDDPLEETDE